MIACSKASAGAGAMGDTLLTSEYLPTAGDSAVELVLLHGWASSAEVWRPFVARMREHASITLVSWAGSEADPHDLEALAQGVLAVAPNRAAYVGWSLGGQLAAHIAHQHPERVSALVTIMSNPAVCG